MSPLSTVTLVLPARTGDAEATRRKEKKTVFSMRLLLLFPFAEHALFLPEAVAGISRVARKLPLHDLDRVVDIHVRLAFELISGSMSGHGMHFITSAVRRKVLLIGHFPAN